MSFSFTTQTAAAQSTEAKATAAAKEALAQKTAEAESENYKYQSDFDKAKEIGDYELDNQDKAYASASKYRQSDAQQTIDATAARDDVSNAAQKDRLTTQLTSDSNLADKSNVAQKDRLTTQLDSTERQQQAGFSQTNKLRTDDNQRAINGFKGNF